MLFLCVTGSAPLAVFMFNFPFSFGAGNEFGTPAGFLFATVVLTIFSVGYVPMAQEAARRGRHVHVRQPRTGTTLGHDGGLLVDRGLRGVRRIADRRVRPVPAGLDRAEYARLRRPGAVDPAGPARHPRHLIARVLRHPDLGQGAGRGPDRRARSIIIAYTVGVFIQGGNDGHLGRSGAAVERLPHHAASRPSAALGIFIAFWSWVGFEAAPNYAEESKDPVRDDPDRRLRLVHQRGRALHARRRGRRSAYGPANQAFEALGAGRPRVSWGEQARSRTRTSTWSRPTS